MRERLRDWLDQAGIDKHLGFDLVTACTEAFNNAIEHPFKPTRASIDVKANLVGDTVVLTIHDTGRWQDVHPGSNRPHNGYPLMRSLVNAVEVTRDDTGTVVTLQQRI